MNIKFKILWLEDEISWFKMEETQIVRILSEHYLIPQIERRDGDDFDIHELTGNDYDLILMDYKLSDGKTGDDIAKSIRHLNLLTDILFYSSQEKDMLTAIYKQNPPLDGVYFTKRNHTIFTEKVKKLIDKIVKRSEDIINLRGFVLDNTSDFEVRIKDILNVCWGKFDSNQKQILHNKMIEVLKQKKDKLDCNIKKIEASADLFFQANNDPYLLSIKERLDIFKEIETILYENYKIQDEVFPKKFSKYYMNNLNVYRNQLGHVKMGDMTIVVNRTIIPIDQELHRMLRKNISEIDSMIRGIEQSIDTI